MVCKKLIKNSHPLLKKCQKTAGGIFFLTHTVNEMTTDCLLGAPPGRRVYSRGTGPVWPPLGAATAKR